MVENRISRQIDKYLDYKRSLGFKLISEETILRRFSDYTISIGYNGPFTQDIALTWAASDAKSDKTMGRRMEAIRPFSKFAHSFDQDAEIITNLIYKNIHDRPTPYIYSESETLLMMEECKKLYSPDGIRAYSIETVIGLLWSTGLRPSEPINLTIEDVDLQSQLLCIRKTKFSKERVIPIDLSVASKLSEYKQWIVSKLGDKNPKDPFFYTTGGASSGQTCFIVCFSIDTKVYKRRTFGL